MLSFLKSAKGAARAAGDLQAQVRHLRDLRAQLRAEADALRARPGEVSETLAKLDAEVSRLAAEGRARMSASGLDGRRDRIELRAGTHGAASPSGTVSGADALATLAFFAPDLVREKMAAEIAALAADADTISAADRAAELSRCDADLRACEASEELAIRAAEEAGIEILRRADALPEIVLATDRHLERGAPAG